jgi:uncharacterized lipoprotein NlpE involved in copper resistance
MFLSAILWIAPGSARTPAYQPPFALPASFGGMSLCADCSGIRLTLTVRPDGTFALRHVYLGKAPSTTWYDRGTWSYGRAGSTLALHGQGKNPQLYRVLDPRTLQPLDASGNPLPTHVQPNLKRLPTVVRLGMQARDGTLVATLPSSAK